MSGSDDAELHDTRTVRDDGSSVVVSIPQSAVDRSGIEVGEQVMVATGEGGQIVLVPWSEDDIRGFMD